MGKFLSKYLRRKGKDPDKFCKKIKYCERKKWFKDRLAALEDLSEEKAIGAKIATETIVEVLPDGAELYLLNDDKSYVLGAITALNNKHEMVDFRTGLPM